MNNEKREAWTAARHALRTPDGDDDNRQRGQQQTKRTERTTTNSEDENKQKGRRETEITTTMLAGAQHSVSHSLCLLSHSHSLCLSSLSVALNFVWWWPSFLSCRSLGMVLSVPLSSSFLFFLSFSSSLFQKVREEKTKKNTTERAVEREMNKKRKREQSKTERRPKRESD